MIVDCPPLALLWNTAQIWQASMLNSRSQNCDSSCSAGTDFSLSSKMEVETVEVEEV